MTSNTVPYRAALKLIREASVGLSDWDAETLEMYIDDLYERRADRGVYMDWLEEAFDVYFTCYYRAGWTLMGRVRAEDKAQSDAIVNAENKAAFAAALAAEGVEVEADEDDIILTEDMEDDDDIVLSPSWFVPAPAPVPVRRRDQPWTLRDCAAVALASAVTVGFHAFLYFTMLHPSFPSSALPF